MKRTNKAFTLIELMIVILIVAIVAAVSVPIMRGHVERAKWSEAHGGAGTIRVAVRTYASRNGVTRAVADLNGQIASSLLSQLNFLPGDLQGTYFQASDYRISSIDADGNATIVVDGTNAGLTGSKTFF